MHYLFFIAYLLTSDVFAAQKTTFFVGNGGDFVICEQDQLPQTLYFFDYAYGLVNYDANDMYFDNVVQTRTIKNDIVNATNTQELVVTSGLLRRNINDVEKHVLNLLKINIPEAGAKFSMFLNNKFRYNPQSVYRWLPWKDLPPISDEETIILNSICRVKQSVIRVKVDGNITFYYDLTHVMVLQITPLQESFLTTHEWLWDHVNSSAKIRKLNWFLHSKDATQLSPIQFKQKMKQLGWK